MIRPWLEVGPPPIRMVEPMPYTSMQSLLDPLFPPGRRTYWKSGYLTEFTDDAIQTAASLAATVQSPYSVAEFVLWGGAVARVDPDDTAFGERGGRFLYNASSNRGPVTGRGPSD